MLEPRSRECARRAFAFGVAALVLANATAARPEDLFGPWSVAPTNADATPGEGAVHGLVLSQDDEVGARFALDNVTGIEVAVYLKTGVEFDPSAHVLQVFVRQDPGPGMLPGSVVAGPATLEVTPGRAQGWYTARVSFPGPLVGPHWVTLYVAVAPDDGSLAMMAEHADRLEHELTWDPVAGRYRERDGLFGQATPGTWTLNAPDPFVRIRPRTGTGALPLVTTLSATPSPAVTGSPVAITGTADDADGEATIDSYRFTYTLDGDPTVRVLDAGPVTPAHLQGGEVEVTWAGLLPEGAYRVSFDVRDDTGLRADGTSALLFVDRPQQGVPPVTEISDVSDECGTDLCRYVAEITALEEEDGDPATVEVTYSVEVDPAVPMLQHVWFRMLQPDDTEFASVVDAEPDGNRYDATFDVTALPGRGVWTVAASVHVEHPMLTEAEAEDEDLVRLAETSSTVSFPPPPAWYVEDKTSDHVADERAVWLEDDRLYRFTGRITNNPRLYYEEVTDLGVVGQVENSGGIRVDVEEEYDLQAAVTKSGEGGIDLTILNKPIYDDPFDVNVTDEGRYEVSYITGELYKTKETVFDETVFKGAVDGVQFDINLAIDVGFSAAAEVCSSLGTDLMLTPQPVCLGPIVSPFVALDLSADLWGGVATVGGIGTPTFDFALPLCYHHTGSSMGGPIVYPDVLIQLRVLFEAYVCVGGGILCWESDKYEVFEASRDFDLPNVPESCFTLPLTTAASSDPPPAGQPSSRPPFASPDIASNGAGQALAVWIHESTPPALPAVHVYYSYSPTAGVWTAPAPVDASIPDYFETDPRVTWIDATTALLVVTRNDLTDTSGLRTIDEALPYQELVSYTYQVGSGWTPLGKVHDDGGTPRADGRARLSQGPHLTALGLADPFLVWVRDTDGTATPCNTEIAASRFDLVTSTWDPMTVISSALGGCRAEVDVDYDRFGNAMAVWVRDGDGDPNTGGDRSIRAAEYDGLSGSWMGSYAAVGSEPGVLWPTVRIDWAGQPTIVFTAREGAIQGMAPEYGGETGEFSDYLYSAHRPLGAPLGTAFPSVRRIGGPMQHGARWPRMAFLRHPSVPQTWAFLGARWFQGIGADGTDGEAVVFANPVLSVPDPTTCWASPLRLTDDDVTDWQVAVDVDLTGPTLRVLWATARPDLPTAPFGEGFHSLELRELTVGTNYAVDASSIALATPYPAPGEETEISFDVVDRSLARTSQTVTATVSLDTPGNVLASMGVDVPICEDSFTVTVPWTSDGLPHQVIVVVDPLDAVLETDEEDNSATATISTGPPPDHLSAHVSVRTGTVTLRWDSPEQTDVTAPEVAHYRVESDYLGSFTPIGATPGRSFVTHPSFAGVRSYRVVAVNAVGGESPPSQPVTVNAPFGAGRLNPGPALFPPTGPDGAVGVPVGEDR